MQKCIFIGRNVVTLLEVNVSTCLSVYEQISIKYMPCKNTNWTSFAVGLHQRMPKEQSVHFRHIV